MHLTLLYLKMVKMGHFVMQILPKWNLKNFITELREHTTP